MKSNNIRILSIDGGGIRGIIPAVILRKLEEKLREHHKDAHIGDYFDLFAGTSTGGIIVSGLLVPGRDKYEKWRYSTADLVKFYKERGPGIFDNNWVEKIRSGFGLRRSKYNVSGIEAALEDYFGNLTLSQLRKPTLIPAFDIESRSAYFFTQHDAVLDYDQDFYLRDVVRATTAAPTYFEAATIHSLEDFRHRRRFTFIDGGVFANNPALCAYAEARAHSHFRTNRNKKINAAGMTLLSIGTGYTKHFAPPEEVRRWGLVQWSRPLINVMMGGIAETVHYQLNQVFGSVDAQDQYTRIDCRLPDYVSPGMDDASPENIQAVIRFAEELMESHEINRQLAHIVQGLLQD